MKKIFFVLAVLSVYCSVFSIVPKAVNDSVWVAKRGVRTVSPLTNDTLHNVGTHTLTVLRQGTYDSAFVSGTNQLTIATKSDFTGQDTVTYSVCNSLGECDTAFVLLNIGVRANNETEVAVSRDSMLLAIDCLGNDENHTADTLSYSVVESEKFDAEFVGNRLVIYRRATGSCAYDTIVYAICAGEICDTASIPLNSDCYVEEYLPTGFSPNGDGINDKLVFKFLGNSKPVVLNVFNRYGDLIYENNDYNNDWDGIPRNFKKGATDGSYWYTVRTRHRQYIQYLVIQR